MSRDASPALVGSKLLGGVDRVSIISMNSVCVCVCLCLCVCVAMCNVYNILDSFLMTHNALCACSTSEPLLVVVPC